MDFNRRVDDLKDRLEQLKGSVAEAAEGSHEQLNQRIDQLRTDTDRVLTDAKQ
jgi:hypothetical protein